MTYADVLKSEYKKESKDLKKNKMEPFALKLLHEDESISSDVEWLCTLWQNDPNIHEEVINILRESLLYCEKDKILLIVVDIVRKLRELNSDIIEEKIITPLEDELKRSPKRPFAIQRANKVLDMLQNSDKKNKPVPC